MNKLRTSAQIVAGRRHSLGYSAIEETTRRRRPAIKTTSELAVLTGTKRERAQATAREDRRNMSLLAWMIRRHLDNVSRFTAHIRLKDESLNAIVRRLLYWHSRPRQFDALGKHGRDEWLRMFEACKVITGDCAGLKVMGGRLQGIEGDRIARPSNVPDDKNVTEDGLTKTADGSISGYCVCKRGGSRGDTLTFERVVPAGDMIFDAYWPERFDSDRGVSPLLTALNEGADVRETWEWLVLKAKTSALFGLAFTRTGEDPLAPTWGTQSETAPTTEPASYSAQIAAAVKARGIINLDMDEGDKVTEIESKTPNASVIEFTRELIRSVLLALDIPFTFYDSLTASFSARIADRNEYEESCEWKRDKNIGVLDAIYGGWLLPVWAESDLFGFGTALKAAKMSPEEVAASLRWVPAGRPWLDRSNEMSGHILALAAGVTSTPRICSAYGDDAYEIAAEQKDFIEKCGIPLLYAQGGQVPVNDLLKEARNGNTTQAK